VIVVHFGEVEGEKLAAFFWQESGKTKGVLSWIFIGERECFGITASPK